MADFQAQLEKYRNEKKRQAQYQNIKTKLKKMIMSDSENPKKSDQSYEVEESSSEDEYDDEEFIGNGVPLDEIQRENKIYKYVLYTVMFLFWVTLYILFIELQFGIVFLMVSALIMIYYNTRTRKRRKGEISAYSVFNKNCESISGTLKAEQFEREMGYTMKT